MKLQSSHAYVREAKSEMIPELKRFKPKHRSTILDLIGTEIICTRCTAHT